MKGRPTPKKPPTQIKAQFAQTISGQFVQTVPPLPFKTSRKDAEEFAQTVCANCFYLGLGGFLGGSPSLEGKLGKLRSMTQRFGHFRAELAGNDDKSSEVV